MPSPRGGLAVACAPPDARTQAGGVRLDALRTGAPAERTRGVPLGQTFALHRAEELLEVLAGDVGASRIFRAGVAERLVSADDRLG